MNKITEKLLSIVADWDGGFKGAFNIREDGACAGRESSRNIRIESKQDGPGLIIEVAPGTQDEVVFIPAVVTRGGVDDLVYNDFIIGENAKVRIVAGCGVHTDDGSDARHNGIHRFVLEKGAHVIYEEKHVGQGEGTGKRRIDPITDIVLKEDAVIEIDTLQLGGVDSSIRKTQAVVGQGARLLVRERIMTEGQQRAETDFVVAMDGDDSAVDLISRSVARGHSYQEFRSAVNGNARCKGHSACDAILVDQGRVYAAPALMAAHVDASLIHEAAIGKIAGEQLIKLQTLGLTPEEAEARIIDGFLK